MALPFPASRPSDGGRYSFLSGVPRTSQFSDLYLVSNQVLLTSEMKELQRSQLKRPLYQSLTSEMGTHCYLSEVEE